MSNPSVQTPTSPRDWWVSLGMTVSAMSAALSSFSGLYELALAAGWAGLMAPLFPLTVDAFAATATRVWLAASTTSQRARRFARRCAIGAILLSLAGNAVWHLIAAGLLTVSWGIVLGVGAVAPLVLGLVSHLAVLRRQVDVVVPLGARDGLGTELGVPQAVLRTEMVPGTVLRTKRAVPKATVRPAVRAQDGPRYGDEEALLAAARTADEEYRVAHGGKAITRDELRKRLRISSGRATEVRRRIQEVPTKTQGGQNAT